MTPIYSEEEFNNCKQSDSLPLQCELCANIFYGPKKDIVYSLKKRPYAFKYCSEECRIKSTITKQNIKCLQCNKEFLKVRSKITTNNFCSRSCSAIYNNTHKTKGTRVSKLEVWLKEQLSIKYPDWEIKYNEKETINSELDIHIPHLNLAFELNGIFHYEPIYGQEKLSQIKNNDDRKFQACLENKIELVIMDVSSLNYWKPEKGEKYLNIITEIINRKVPHSGV